MKWRDRIHIRCPVVDELRDCVPRSYDFYDSPQGHADLSFVAIAMTANLENGTISTTLAGESVSHINADFHHVHGWYSGQRLSHCVALS